LVSQTGWQELHRALARQGVEKLFIFGWLHRRTEILEAKGVHLSIMVCPAYGATSEKYLNIKML